MVDRVAHGRVVDKAGGIADREALLGGENRSGGRLVRHLLNVETGALGAQIIDLANQGSGQFRLKADVPGLRVHGAVIAIHCKCVENRLSIRCHCKAVGQRQRIRDAGRQYVDTYLTMLKRYAEGDFGAAINSPMVAKVMEDMMHWLPEEQPLPERVQCCIEFFQSQHFSEVPNEWLSSHMFATIREMVKRGEFSNREEFRKSFNGVFEDFKHISLYAPYCDAIVIDKSMADLVSRPTVDLEKRYGVKVFSLTSWDALLKWLDSFEAGMSEEHKAGIAAAYP